MLPLLVLLALVPSCRAALDAWHFDTISTLLLARLDPIVSPNATSGHMHRIVGGSNFAAFYDSQVQKGDKRGGTGEGGCTSVYEGRDGSNYWTPQLYWTGKPLTSDDSVPAGQTYTPIASSHRFYYFLGRDNPDVPVNPFPEGLRMVVGKMGAKTLEETGLPEGAFSYTCQKDHYILPTQDLYSKQPDFTRDCPEGLKTEIRFPPCWDGKRLYASDGSHMAFATGIHGGYCPVSHPYRIPGILLENTWHIEEIAPGIAPKGRVIWAHGDTTGFGYHADFAEGWDTEFLRAALKDPRCVNLGHSMAADECPALAITDNDNKVTLQATCKAALGVPEDTGNVDKVPTNALPGCNPPWSSGPKPTCATPATQLDLSGGWLGKSQPLEATAATLAGLTSNFAMPVLGTGAGWTNLGCLWHSAMNTEVNMTTYIDKTLMTVKVCQDWCAELGKPYAGIELGNTCHCTDNFYPATATVMLDQCDIKCPGDATKTCGGQGNYDIYYSSAVEKAGPQAPSDDPTYMGCRFQYSVNELLSPQQQDIEGCRAYCKDYTYFGLEGHAFCRCGNELKDVQGVDTRRPEYNCDWTCWHNSSEVCGGVYYQSTYLVSGTHTWGNDVTPVNATIVSSSSAASAAATSSTKASSTSTSSTSTSAAVAVATPVAVASHTVALEDASDSTSSKSTASSDATSSASPPPAPNQPNVDAADPPAPAAPASSSSKASTAPVSSASPADVPAINPSTSPAAVVAIAKPTEATCGRAVEVSTVTVTHTVTVHAQETGVKMHKRRVGRSRGRHLF